MDLTVIVRWNAATTDAVRQRCLFSLEADREGIEILVWAAEPSMPETELPVFATLREAVDAAKSSVLYVLGDDSATYLGSLRRPFQIGSYGYRYVHLVAHNDVLHMQDIALPLAAGSDLEVVDRFYDHWGGMIFSKEMFFAAAAATSGELQLITYLHALSYASPAGNQRRYILADHYIVTCNDSKLRFSTTWQARERYCRPTVPVFPAIDRVVIEREVGAMRAPPPEAGGEQQKPAQYPSLEQVVAIFADRVSNSRSLRRVWKYGRLGKMAFLVRNLWRSLASQRSQSGVSRIRSMEDARSVPVIINNRNRLSTTRELVEWLSSIGQKKIIVLDNASEYPPLLEWYQSQNLCDVVYLEENCGPLALGTWDGAEAIMSEPYVYTDSDVVPAEDTPDDLILRLARELTQRRAYDKAGPALRIDDLPATRLTDKVRAHEAQFWVKSISPDVYYAPIDTTFALYREGTFGGWWLRAIRVGGAYAVRHIPWYNNPEQLSSEEMYYIAHARNWASWASENK